MIRELQILLDWWRSYVLVVGFWILGYTLVAVDDVVAVVFGDIHK